MAPWPWARRSTSSTDAACVAPGLSRDWGDDDESDTIRRARRRRGDRGCGGVLRLVGAGVDGQKLAVDIKDFNRPDCLEDIANLGLTLTEGKQLLARVQQEVVAAQVRHHAMLRPDCQSCGGRSHMKDWRRHRVATLFGEVRVKRPRLVLRAAVVARPVAVGHRTAGRPAN